jgi:hypothetical protein
MQKDIIYKRFEYNKNLATGRAKALFAVFDEPLTKEEKEALIFLYAYMPLHDLASHDGKFYLQNVRSSLKARKEMTWGASIPDDIFMRFVLFCRVNNENMDASREIFYHELKERVSKLSMNDAALEVNHWCYEKATYRPTDIRTASPLNIIKTAFGRCGEESTLTTSALRSVCIPTRQCYTPRWAHCDDNHAWVELWVDGAWHFIGACEPVPILDLAWFQGSAKRAMMVHTNVPGDYTSCEEVVVKDNWHTELNLLSHYAKVKKIEISVLNEQSQPVSGAVVKYMVFNLAEFFPIATLSTSEKGTSSLTTGLGDLLVFVHKNNLFGYERISVETTDKIEIILNQDGTDEYIQDIDISPPKAVPIDHPEVSEEDIEKNAQRKKQGDSIRAAYESTFMKREQANELAKECGFAEDRIWKLVETSRGNWREITEFIRSMMYREHKEVCINLLETLVEKDVRDIEPAVLNDHFTNSRFCEDKEVFNKFILAPRIANELLVPYKGFFQSRFSKEEIDRFRQNPFEVAKWMATSIKTVEETSSYRNPITPIGVYELKKADSFSKNIFIVALCRSFGIPSRLEPANKNPQFLQNKEWIYFAAPDEIMQETGYIKLYNEDKVATVKPEYTNNFSISKLIQGSYSLLDYKNINFDVFAEGIKLETGSYLLVTGNRLADGTILTRLNFFSVESGKTKEISFEIRKETKKNINLGKVSSKLSKKMITAWIKQGTEPTRHFVGDLARLKETFNNSGAKITIYSEKGKRSDLFSAGNVEELPENVEIKKDEGFLLLEEFQKGLDEPLPIDFPIVSFIDNEGSIRYLSTGYKIGLGEQLLKAFQG